MKATINILGKNYEAEGETARQALEGLEYKGFAKVKSVLTVGEKAIVLSHTQTQRLFSQSPMMKEIAVKQVALRFE